MTKLSKEQIIQEKSYNFPYHYIPSFENGNFTQVKTLSWGYEYISYVRFVIEKVEELEFDSLLDVGCGDGRFLYEASRVFPGKKLVGVDFSERAINYAQIINQNSEFIHGSVYDNTLIRDKFELITLIETLEHIPPDNVILFIKSMHNLLKDDGLLLVTVPTKNISVTPKHYQHFDVELLEKYFSSFFSISKYYFINRNSQINKILERMLHNRLFILNEKHLLNLIYSFYEKYMLNAKEENAKRICVLFKKKR